ncbi:proline-rich protein HaeIII subfamily 1-like [Lepisosteus oculatus]|uniref:proline-rich protein HaeIII subfamily 1-like n=1 Tax=Lepisosteus oculatus TaxID=7918 RepID=UPI0035F52872
MSFPDRLEERLASAGAQLTQVAVSEIWRVVGEMMAEYRGEIARLDRDNAGLRRRIRECRAELVAARRRRRRRRTRGSGGDRPPGRSDGSRLGERSPGRREAGAADCRAAEAGAVPDTGRQGCGTEGDPPPMDAEDGQVNVARRHREVEPVSAAKREPEPGNGGFVPDSWPRRDGGGPDRTGRGSPGREPGSADAWDPAPSPPGAGSEAGPEQILGPSPGGGRWSAGAGGGEAGGGSPRPLGPGPPSPQVQQRGGHRCTQCGRAFKRKCSLKSHLRAHARTPPPKVAGLPDPIPAGHGPLSGHTDLCPARPLAPGTTFPGASEPTGMSLDCGRKPEHREEIHMNAGRTRKLHTDTTPGPRLEPRAPGLQKCLTLQEINTLVSVK